MSSTSVRTDDELHEGELPGLRVLFIGMGDTALCWYRCVLPAMALGADWVGVAGEPPNLTYITGLVGGDTVVPDPRSYDVVVIQQPRGTDWLRFIRKLQALGVTVLFEIDDYVHGIRNQADHDYRDQFTKKDLAQLELNMRVCDGLLVSTPFLAQRYRAFNPNVWVCRNGVDLGRYDLTLPPRDGVTIGWAGATAHTKAVMPWLEEVGKLMLTRDDVRFVSIGQDFAQPFRDAFGEHRAMSVPFTLVDNYPAAMTLMDIALAPAGKTNFFRGKSDLRWVEASALGIPVIADPAVYPNIEHGVTGFHARTPQEAGRLIDELVADRSLRLQVGATAREEVRRTRRIEAVATDWLTALSAAGPTGG